MIDCTVNMEENATLMFNDKNLTVDNKKVKYVAKNVFNITSLVKEDGGIYACKVCNKEYSDKITLRISIKGI